MEPEPAPRRPPTPWITIALIAANVAVFAWELASGADAWSPAPQKLFELGGNLPAVTLGGHWWRLGSAMFLHAGVLHIGMNMFCLWQARIVEVAFGRAAFATLYVVSGLVGGIATALHGTNAVSVGASGAVFGVYGAFFALLLVRRAAFPRDVWERVMRQMGMFLGINLVAGLSIKGIDMSAHLGGIAAGAIGGALLMLRTPRGPAPRARTIALGAAGLAIVAGVLIVKHTTDLQPLLDEAGQVEQQCIERWNEVFTQNTQGKLSNADAALRIERDILPPWKEMRARIDAAETPRTARWTMLRTYYASREAAWEAALAALRAPQDQALQDAAVSAWQQADQDFKAFAAASN